MAKQIKRDSKADTVTPLDDGFIKVKPLKYWEIHHNKHCIILEKGVEQPIPAIFKATLISENVIKGDK